MSQKFKFGLTSSSSTVTRGHTETLPAPYQEVIQRLMPCVHLVQALLDPFLYNKLDIEFQMSMLMHCKSYTACSLVMLLILVAAQSMLDLAEDSLFVSTVVGGVIVLSRLRARDSVCLGASVLA